MDTPMPSESARPVGEQRASPRKLLKARAALTVKGAPALMVRTIDIGANGVCLAFLQTLPIGLTGTLAIDLMVDGKVHVLTAVAKSTYCIFSSGQYKTGFQFLEMELSSRTILAKFLR